MSLQVNKESQKSQTAERQSHRDPQRSQEEQSIKEEEQRQLKNIGAPGRVTACKQGATETSGGEPKLGAEETGHAQDVEGKREEAGELQEQAQTEESRHQKKKKHQEEPEAIPVQNPTHTTPHPTETPEEGRAKVQ